MKLFTCSITSLLIALVILGFVGYAKCVIHLARTDFKAPYKAEVIYGVGTVTGFGAVIGWINIPDAKN